MPAPQQMPQQPSSQTLDTFMKAASQLAVNLGIQTLIIVLQCPKTAEQRFIASPGAKEALRSYVAGKYGFEDGSDTGWEQ